MGQLLDLLEFARLVLVAVPFDRDDDAAKFVAEVNAAQTSFEFKAGDPVTPIYRYADL